MIPNCPIDWNDVIAADEMFGRDVGSLKGKTTRRKMGHVKSYIVGLPIAIMDRYRTTTLCIDNMFVNRVVFFMSISRDLHFITAKAFTNRKKATLAECLTKVYCAYLQRGFKIARIQGDSEFECLREMITADLKATLNITGEDEHVPKIE
jgi:hypothetical protein